MFVRSCMIIILSSMLLSSAAVASGPHIEPGPVMPYAVQADMAKFISHGEVLIRMHTLVTRHAMTFDRAEVVHQSPEASRYTFFYKTATTPPTYGSFSVQAGSGVTGRFSVFGVSELHIAAPLNRN